MDKSENLNELFTALTKAQAMMQHAKFNKGNPHFKSRYADLSSVWDAIREPLAQNGLSVIQVIEPSEHGTSYSLKCILGHTSGQFITSQFPILAHKTDSQAFGSAVTYARRYSLASIVGCCADEDDDGDAAKDAPPQEEPKAPTKKLSPNNIEFINTMLEKNPIIKEWFFTKLKSFKIDNIGEIPASMFESIKQAIEKRVSDLENAKQEKTDEN